MHPSPRLTAATATIVFVGTLGLLLVVAGFGIMRLGDDMFEALGFLTPRWGETHLSVLVEMAGLISAPVVIWFGVWFFRKALAAEIRLEGTSTAPTKA